MPTPEFSQCLHGIIGWLLGFIQATKTCPHMHNAIFANERKERSSSVSRTLVWDPVKTYFGLLKIQVKL